MPIRVQDLPQLPVQQLVPITMVNQCIPMLRKEQVAPVMILLLVTEMERAIAVQITRMHYWEKNVLITQAVRKQMY